MKKLPRPPRSTLGIPSGVSSSGVEVDVPYFEFINTLIDASGYANVDIADKLGFTQQTMVSMIRRGKIKLPLDRVEQLAKIIGTDPATLMRRVLAEDAPHVYSLLKTNGSDLYSKQEQKLIETFRNANPDSVNLSDVVLEEIAGVIKAKVAEMAKENAGQVRPPMNSQASREARAKLTTKDE